MNILYIGDVMGEPGIRVVERVLPALKAKHKVGLVVAQAENVSEGKGITPEDFKRLQVAGIDFCTGGNHILARAEAYPLLRDPLVPLIRPANYPIGTPGLGYKYIETTFGKVLVISLLGQIIGKDAGKLMDNPLQVVDKILKGEKGVERAATIVNFHGDLSSEKRIIGHYLDGQVTAVIGDHWHIATADADILPKGTAHITDVGMCGSLDSSLGVKFSSVVPRWRDGHVTRNILESMGRMQFNALLVTVNVSSHLAEKVMAVREIL